MDDGAFVHVEELRNRDRKIEEMREKARHRILLEEEWKKKADEEAYYTKLKQEEKKQRAAIVRKKHKQALIDAYEKRQQEQQKEFESGQSEPERDTLLERRRSRSQRQQKATENLLNLSMRSTISLGEYSENSSDSDVTGSSPSLIGTRSSTLRRRRNKPKGIRVTQSSQRWKQGPPSPSTGDSMVSLVDVHQMSTQILSRDSTHSYSVVSSHHHPSTKVGRSHGSLCGSMRRSDRRLQRGSRMVIPTPIGQLKRRASSKIFAALSMPVILPVEQEPEEYALYQDRILLRVANSRARMIQIAWRGFKWRIEWEAKRHTAAVKIQAVTRALLARIYAKHWRVKKTSAVIKIQRRWVAFKLTRVQRVLYNRYLSSVLTIQRFFRVLRFQKLVRRYVSKQRRDKLRKAFSIALTHYYCHRMKVLTSLRRTWCVSVVQVVWKRKHLDLRVTILRRKFRAAVFIKRWYHRWKIWYKHHMATRMQSIFRGKLARLEHQYLLQSRECRIQIQHRIEQRVWSAGEIQSWWRRMRFRLCVQRYTGELILIQTFCKTYIAVKRVKIIRHAAKRIMRFWRLNKLRQAWTAATHKHAESKREYVRKQLQHEARVRLDRFEVEDRRSVLSSESKAMAEIQIQDILARRLILGTTESCDRGSILAGWEVGFQKLTVSQRKRHKQTVIRIAEIQAFERVERFQLWEISKANERTQLLSREIQRRKALLKREQNIRYDLNRLQRNNSNLLLFKENRARNKTKTHQQFKHVYSVANLLATACCNTMGDGNQHNETGGGGGGDADDRPQIHPYARKHKMFGLDSQGRTVSCSVKNGLPTRWHVDDNVAGTDSASPRSYLMRALETYATPNDATAEKDETGQDKNKACPPTDHPTSSQNSTTPLPNVDKSAQQGQSSNRHKPHTYESYSTLLLKRSCKKKTNKSAILPCNIKKAAHHRHSPGHVSFPPAVHSATTPSDTPLDLSGITLPTRSHQLHQEASFLLRHCQQVEQHQKHFFHQPL